MVIKPHNTVFKKIWLALVAIGPGLFMIGYNIGTGSITTLASAGSRYGLSLLWVLVFACIITFILLVAYQQFTLVTGETAMRGYRKFLPAGNFFALLIIVGMALGEFVGIAGIMGVVTDLIKEWTRLLFHGNGISPVISTAVIVVGAYILFWNGKYTVFEKLLITFVIIMGFSFLLSLFIIVPDPADLIAGMIPGVPEGPGSFLLIASIAGTTSGAIVFVMRSIVVSEKGWTIHDLKQAKTDAFWSAFFMFLLSGTIMALAAGTLYKEGTPVENAIDMVKMLVPIAGRFAISIFVVGVIAAGISTIFPISLILPWLISDYTGKKRDVKSPMYRILGAGAFLLAFTVPVFGGRPVWVLVFAGALQSIVLPIATVAIFVLLNNKKLMGEHKAGLWMNTGLVVSIIFAFVTTYFGVISIIEEIRAVI